MAPGLHLTPIVRHLTDPAARRLNSLQQRKERPVRKTSITIISTLVLVMFAHTAAADPVHFGTFPIDCGAFGDFEIVSKPGMSQVVSANGQDSTSVALLLDYEGEVDGQPLVINHGQYQPPGIRKSANDSRLVRCTDPSFEAPDFFTAWVLFTPASD